MTTYCAPCLADLALVRDAVTTVSGTASCMAHAVLLTHPSDTPQRRLSRLTELRTTAEGKLATASQEDVPALELLVQEYALAGAMDMTVPLRDLAGDRTPRPPKSRRSRGGRPDRPRGEEGRPEGGRPQGGAQGGRPDGASEARGRQEGGTETSAGESGVSDASARADAPAPEPTASRETSAPPEAPPAAPPAAAQTPAPAEQS